MGCSRKTSGLHRQFAAKFYNQSHPIPENKTIQDNGHDNNLLFFYASIVRLF